MTQQTMQEDALEDQRTMRRLAAVIGCFVAASAAMAVIIGVVVG